MKKFEFWLALVNVDILSALERGRKTKEKTEMKTQKHKMIRQGDVLLIPCAAPKNGVTVEKTGPRLVLAQGETTMHEHTVSAEDAELILEGEKMLLHVLRPTRMIVTDTASGVELKRHDPVDLEETYYERRLQRELDVTTLTHRPVSD